jgi:hypothetical protein
MVKKKYIFVLKNIDSEKIERKYDIKIMSNITSELDFIPNNTTKLSELPVEKGSSIDIISFLDESKKIHKCNVCMIDFKTKQELQYYNYNCFWCRNSIDTVPLGCPIKYVSNVAVRTYYSEISKDNYTIKQNITTNNNVDTDKISVINKAHYETDGIFCSFNCIMAFILDNKKDKLYDNSLMLLIKMYNDMMGANKASISPAPHWRLLIEYGGNINIKEFRASFNKIDYEHHGVIKNFPEFNSVGVLYEKKIKF